MTSSLSRNSKYSQCVAADSAPTIKTSYSVSTTALVLNLMMTGIKFYKYLVIILDNDLIEFLDYDEYGMSKIFGEWIKHIADAIDEIIADKKKKLPEKACLEGYPLTYWTTLPHHRYFKDGASRFKFNKALESTIKNRRGMRLIRMKEIWDFDNRNLVDPRTGVITFEGLSTYWKSVDAAIKFNITKHEQYGKRTWTVPAATTTATAPMEAQENKEDNRMHQFFQRSKSNDKYHWERKDRKKLPHPDKKKRH